MPVFGFASKAALSTCDVRLQRLFNEVIKYWDCQVLEGHRGKEAQEAAFKAGNTQLHYPHGKHNAVPSRAVDVAPWPVDWKNQRRFDAFAGFVLGISKTMGLKIRWGGDWNRNLNPADESFIDLPHFELDEE
jgi:peptidoglycan L-alanyl-D-glutamate endopeptidase CwlK